MLQISYWHWWMLAASLLILEFFALGTFGSFFLWPAIAASFIGFITLFFPQLSLEYQVLTLAMISIVSVVIGRLYLGKHPLSSDQPFLNKRGSELVGNTYNISEPIVNGIGKIRVLDSTWRVEGPDCPVDTPVKVVAAGSVRLKVIPLTAIPAKTSLKIPLKSPIKT
ncbi:NfeD family protein [Candidatus Parabeggiatoa sp. HSG14]|uniref:NfeD family protein n=1 Tax=Candidatus Parabeggiatoa sp. HSG14 TaxID=3055593 RepID=UPI0025A7E969|nr:NfeD family protein [Thiotrichales bacterium HSG14]